MAKQKKSARQKPEIQKMMVLSTAHISPQTAEMLNDAASDLPPFATLDWAPAFARDEGWLFYTRPHEDRPPPPADLLNLFAFALEHGCTWLMLDCDGPKMEDDLPMWTW